MHEGDELFHVEINHVDKKYRTTKKKIFESIKSGFNTIKSAPDEIF